MQPRFLGRSDHSLVTIPTELALAGTLYELR
jgi:hypothetical protein